MIPSTSDSATPNDGGGFDSRETLILIDDQPGDNTVRPPTPERLKWFMKERERLAKLGFNLDGTPINPPDANGAH